jgi:hypothetical protein
MACLCFVVRNSYSFHDNNITYDMFIFCRKEFLQCFHDNNITYDMFIFCSKEFLQSFHTNTNFCNEDFCNMSKQMQQSIDNIVPENHYIQFIEEHK